MPRDFASCFGLLSCRRLQTDSGSVRLREEVPNIFAYPARNKTSMKAERLSYVEASMIFDSEFSYGCRIVRLREEVPNIFAYPARNKASCAGRRDLRRDE